MSRKVCSLSKSLRSQTKVWKLTTLTVTELSFHIKEPSLKNKECAEQNFIPKEKN